MKLKLFDRILLVILVIAAILVSFVLFGVSLNLVKLDAATAFIGLFYAHTQNALILAGAGLVVLLIAVRLLLAVRVKRGARPASTLIKQSEFGGTYITLSAVDAMVQKHCRQQDRVVECYSTVQAVENGVKIGVRLAVLPDTDIRTLTDGLQPSLKEYVERLTGITVLEVGLLVENAPVNAIPSSARPAIAVKPE